MDKLFIFIEGKHDLIFVRHVLSNYLYEEKSIIVYPIPYSKKSPSKINRNIKSKSGHYLFLSDLDSDETPCITSKKELRLNRYSNLDSNRVIIVKEEIESWFLAGIDSSINQFKHFNIPPSTDLITKEDFDKLLKEHSIDNKINFLIEVSKHYNIQLASKRNSSFNYFLDKIETL
ncbi:hypothetical protein [Methanobrevibacter sp.]|uniref:hypothetical protein n=1 Tax=Methanobrevibacter sp. TaxID=66852 RepID=UPI00388E42F1